MLPILVAVLSPSSELVVPIGVLCTFIGALVVGTWRLSNRLRDLTDAVRGSWSVRDQEHWAHELDDANPTLVVPKVMRAPDLNKPA